MESLNIVSDPQRLISELESIVLAYGKSILDKHKEIVALNRIEQIKL